MTDAALLEVKNLSARADRVNRDLESVSGSRSFGAAAGR